MNTRKIVIIMDAGIAGTDAYEFYEVPESMTTEELDAFAWQCGTNHAEMYDIYPCCDYSDKEVEDDNTYSEDIEGSWEDYNPEKHDVHSMTGTPSWSVY